MIARLRQLFSRKFVQDTLVLQAGKIGMIGLSLISSVLVWRLMGPGPFGDFALAQSFLIIWQTFDFTGIGTSTGVRLALAIGARDESTILDLMAFYVKLSIAINLGIFVLIALLGGVVAGLLYSGSSGIAGLALGLAFAAVADGLYALVTIAFQSRRSMRTLALMQNANQLALTVLLVTAVLISPTPESLVIARIVHSYATLVLAFVVYERRRADGPVGYPSLRIVFQRARSVSPRSYWRFGVANAIDKNLAQLFIQLPIQLVGVFAGARAVGYLQLALSGITQASVFTSAIFENMQAVVPQAVGRRDYAGLRRNFTRVLLVLAVGGILFYGALALFSPFVIPSLLGAQWLPAIPPLVALAFYGAVNTVGGNFGPLYRAFGQMRGIILIKVLGLALMLTFGIILFQEMASSTFVLDHFWSVTRFIPAALVNGGTGALYGALLINAVFLITVLLTALVTLPELRRRAEQNS